MAGITCAGLLKGYVVESSVGSVIGPYLYSHTTENLEDECFLNKLTRLPLLGSLGGIIRFVLSIFHAIGHGIAYADTGKKGHKYHALSGLCHLLRGAIETIPIGGQVFAHLYPINHTFWMIRMFNKGDEMKEPRTPYPPGINNAMVIGHYIKAD